MVKFMLDTDICIYTMKRKPPKVKRMFNIHTGDMCISSVTLGELEYGVENSSDPKENRKVLDGFVHRIEVFDFDAHAARQFGQLKMELKNNLLGAYDLMIAAHARGNGQILVTNNTKEYKRVKGLRIENWTR